VCSIRICTENSSCTQSRQVSNPVKTTIDFVQYKAVSRHQLWPFLATISGIWKLHCCKKEVLQELEKLIMYSRETGTIVKANILSVLKDVPERFPLAKKLTQIACIIPLTWFSDERRFARWKIWNLKWDLPR